MAYVTVAVLTATTFVLAGYLREQVCIYMCPWPRIQAAMLDEDSLVVTYNDWRGEPRSRHRKKSRPPGERSGDCVDCNACVAVCPTGIDIRDGQQLECITCALCIDACDSVMDKVGLPKGLISYSTLKTYDAHKAGGLAVIGWRAFLRPRTFVYGAIWLAVGLAMFYALLHRERLEVNVLNDRNPIYVRLSDGSIRNGFTVKILNMEQRPRSFVLSAEGLPGSTMTMTGGDGEPLQEFTIDVDADKLRAIKVYVAVPPLLLAKRAGRPLNSRLWKRRARPQRKRAASRPSSTRPQRRQHHDTPLHRLAYGRHHGFILCGHHCCQPDHGVLRQIELDRTGSEKQLCGEPELQPGCGNRQAAAGTGLADDSQREA